MVTGKKIKELRSALKLTQTDFAKKLGLSQNTIANYECDRRTPSEQVIISICREFNVSHFWLVDGKGDMFLPEPAGVIDELKVQYNLSDIETKIVKNYLNLNKSQRENFIETIKQIFNLNT